MRILRNTLTALATALALWSCGGDKTPMVNYKLWLDWPERQLPDFSTLGEPDKVGVKNNFDLVDIDETLNHYALSMETVLKVKTEEEYTFKASTDDGSKFYVDGELLYDNDGAHGPITKVVTKKLPKGKHLLRLEYFDCDKGQSINFLYSTPTIPWREINDRLLEEEDKATDKDSFVKPQIDEALARLNAWKGSDEVMSFAIVTDVHTAGRFSYKHIGHAVTAAKAFGCDFMENFGDIGLNAYPATENSIYAKAIVDNVQAQMLKYDGVWLYTPGNHDWDAGEGKYFTDNDLHEFFQKPWEEKAGDAIHFVPGKTYGWYDVPGKGIRIIFLNSQGTGTQNGSYYLFDDEQMAWFRGLLDSTPADMPVLVTAHYMPHPLGRWTNSNPSEENLQSNRRIMDILADFATRGTLIGMVTGDAHVNMHAREDGVNYFISQGYGWVVPDLMLPGTTHAFFDYKENLCIDVFAVKPSKHEVHTFRIGAGGEAFDCVFDY
ncbi:MAG: metallophosphoesterase [Bacteroidales bacterium]|nr:metallophosphoesterase [Bacteroidales bacterium]